MVDLSLTQNVENMGRPGYEAIATLSTQDILITNSNDIIVLSLICTSCQLSVCLVVDIGNS